jgi:exodeoxyribonuclease VII large subunit
MNDDAAARRIEGVSRIVQYMGRLIAENRALKSIAVRGEVSGLSNKNGRLYFDLKEGTDVLNCVAWSNAVAKLPPFNNGDEVIASGDFGTYPARSSYQLSVLALELSGIGRLYARVEALRKRLLAEGLFDAARKRPMPLFPRRVALISARGKGAEDFLTTMARRAPHIQLSFIETRVQGEGAQIEIAEALDRASVLDVDAIVLARGGGSYEDLFAFNEEPVVRAIVRAKHPVLTAIGHTGNDHLADEAADKSVETPSNAAQYFGEIRDTFVRRVDGLVARLDRALLDKQRMRVQRYDYATAGLGRIAREFVVRKRQRLLVLERRIGAQTPVARLAARGRRMAEVSGRLYALARGYTVPARARAQVLAARLDANDPQRPLQRGFAMLFHEGVLVRDAGAVPIGSRIEARVQHGTLVSRVEERRDE